MDAGGGQEHELRVPVLEDILTRLVHQRRMNPA